MAEITREHLELAALAAGHTIYGWCVLCDDRISYADIGPDESVAWCPHTDPGDAARLAVRLNLWAASDRLAAFVAQDDDEPHAARVVVKHNGTEPDKLRAWREAVVLCAAAVGERMQKGGA